MWLTDLQIVLPDRTIERGALQITGTQIAAIVEGDPPSHPSQNGAQVIPCRGLTAIPGIIDMHGDMLENEAEPRPGVHFPLDLALIELDKRLAANGITTAYASLSFWDTLRRERQRSTERACEMIGMISRIRDQLLVDMMVHARYEVTTPTVAEPLRQLIADRQIQLLSLMDHTPGQGQYRDVEQYIDVIARWRNVHRTEVEAETQLKIQMAQDDSIWPLAAEVVELVAAQGIPIASHDDDTRGKIALMAQLGVTISEFPVTLTAAQEACGRGMAVVMGAPNVLRGQSHNGNLSALEAIRAGVVDLLAADYSPAALIQAVFAIVEQGVLPLHEAARLVGQNPAHALGLRDRGRLEVGMSADIALIEQGRTHRVRGTIRHGIPIYWDGAMARRAMRI
jgi:alpha-D-ribose 1-methylphosphonate 5-triphosphate diphosphatase